MATYRKFIFVCTGSDCKKNGCKSLLRDVNQLLKTDPHTGKWKVVKTKCMDFCKSGPVGVINNELIKRMKLDDLREKI
jgi:NADH:ubiquinone oxidoreductase subunit E